MIALWTSRYNIYLIFWDFSHSKSSGCSNQVEGSCVVFKFSLCPVTPESGTVKIHLHIVAELVLEAFGLMTLKLIIQTTMLFHFIDTSSKSRCRCCCSWFFTFRLITNFPAASVKVLELWMSYKLQLILEEVIIVLVVGGVVISFGPY